MALDKEPKQPTLEELQAALAQAQADLEKSNTEKQELLQAKTELEQTTAELNTKVEGLEGQVGQLESAKGQLETQLASIDAPKAGTKPAAKVKPVMVTVVSATQFSYDIGNGQRATPDVPVKAERYPGNLLDSQMNAGYVVEFES